MKRTAYTINVMALAIALFGSPSGIEAQKVLTLDECMSMAKENSIKIHNADNEVMMAKHTKREALTKFFPTIDASATAMNASEHLLQIDLMPGMGLAMLKDGVVGMVSVAQPIFAGGQIVNGNKLAGVGVEVSRIKAEEAENDVELTTQRYFWQVVILKEKLKTIELLEAQLETLYNDVEVGVKVGITTRNDLLQVNLKRNDILSARINIENNLAISRQLLAHHVGSKEDSVDVAYCIDTEGKPQLPDDILTDHSSALASTAKYRLLENNVRASKLQQRIAVGRNMPTIGVGASWMYENLFEGNRNYGVAFVTAKVPLSGWWGGSHSIKKHRLQTRNAENLLRDNSELLIIAMQKAWNDVQNAYRQALIAHSSIEQSTENLRLNQDYYAAGTVKMSDLLNAQTLYQQSRDKYVEALAELEMKTCDYLHATGR